MTTPASLTFSQISTRVMNQLRIPTSNTTEGTKIAAVINEVYRDICAKQDWWWLIKRYPTQTLRTLSAAQGDLGAVGPASVAVTQGSTTITFSDSTLNALDLTGRKLSIPASTPDPNALFTIGMWTVPPVGTLDTPYTGDSSTSTSYRVYGDMVILPIDAGKILRVSRFGYPVDMERIGIEEMERRKMFDRTEGAPQAWSVYDFTTTGDPTTTRKLIVHPFPDNFYRIDIWYRQTLNTELDADVEPFIPDDYRQVLIYGALARCYPVFLNDTERGGYFQSLFNDVLALMAAQQREYAVDRPGIEPQNFYRRAWRRPRTAYTLGSWFDTLPNQP